MLVVVADVDVSAFWSVFFFLLLLLAGMLIAVVCTRSNTRDGTCNCTGNYYVYYQNRWYQPGAVQQFGTF